MVFALAFVEDYLFFFILYCAMPLFICFLSYTLILRERDTNLRVREIIQNIFRKLL
jgi:hypothetical protein